MNFAADSMMRSILDQSSHMFHVIVGLDPLGNFSAVENLSYDNDAFEYAELGRNHAPVRLPWNPVGKPGDITLRWGMVIRSKMYSWMNDVEVGKDYRKNLYIIQLSRKKIPLRIYHLTGCFPLGWRAADFNTEQSAAVGTEELRIAYDQVDLLNLALLSGAVSAIMDLLQDRSSEGVGRWDPPGWEPTEGVYEDPIQPPDMKKYMQNLKSGEDLVGGARARRRDVGEGEAVERWESPGWEPTEGEGGTKEDGEGAGYEQDVKTGEDQAPDENEKGAFEATKGEGGEKEGPGDPNLYEGAPSEPFEIHDMSLYDTIWGMAGLSEEDLAAREAEWEALKAAWYERMGG